MIFSKFTLKCSIFHPRLVAVLVNLLLEPRLFNSRNCLQHFQVSYRLLMDSLVSTPFQS